jgi:hypothetical protein
MGRMGRVSYGKFVFKRLSSEIQDDKRLSTYPSPTTTHLIACILLMVVVRWVRDEEILLFGVCYNVRFAGATVIKILWFELIHTGFGWPWLGLTLGCFGEAPASSSNLSIQFISMNSESLNSNLIYSSNQQIILQCCIHTTQLSEKEANAFRGRTFFFIL